MSSATNYFDGAAVKTFSFVVNPPFYNTAWFYAVATACVGGIVFLVIRAREKNLKARERSEKEKIKFQLDTLKNQVNPHFLFNSFNTLIGMIEENKDVAVEYVEKLSDFYRHITLYREQNLIPLRKELDMIENYCFLQLKRYKHNFRMVINIPDDQRNHMIPPLTLQLLVENALKHNIVSSGRPLIIDIAIEKDYLVVRNNLQRKVAYESSTGLGLNNIISRFKLLTDKKVTVHESPDYFTVYVPLLDQPS